MRSDVRHAVQSTAPVRHLRAVRAGRAVRGHRARGHVGALAFAATFTIALSVHAQVPENRGALAFAEWDAGGVMAAGTSIRTRVVYPTDAAMYPLVGVIHGASRNGSFHIELARTLASRGFVVVLPDMPCGVTGCDHNANARQITALLEWAVAQSADAASRIVGRVDSSRRGLIGHSWGALASHLTAARDRTIDSVVLFDPNDDGTVGRDATPMIMVPEAQLLAQTSGVCNNQWNEGAVTPMLPPPRLQLTVSRSGHCDPEQPGDVFCPILCGSGDPSTSTVFRRYAVAWTACILQNDVSMAPWLGGASMAGDVTGSRVMGVVSGGLDGLPCRRMGPGPDGGTPDGGTVDAATPTDGASGGDVTVSDVASSPDGAAMMDSGPTDLDGSDDATPQPDSVTTTDADRNADTARDAADPSDGGARMTRTGCGCRIASAHDARRRAFAVGAWIVAVAVVLLRRVR